MSDQRATLLALAEEHRAKANAARHERYLIMDDTGESEASEHWDVAVKEATAEIRGRWARSAAFAPLPVVPSDRDMARTRVVPSDYIAIRAEDVAGMQAALLAERERRYVAEAQVAEMNARNVEDLQLLSIMVDAHGTRRG
jgi:nucleotide-binding universal stress UspA family protein